MNGDMDTKVPEHNEVEVDEEEEDIGCDEVDDCFVPSPFVPLQEQIEKDKVYIFQQLLFNSFSLLRIA